MTPTMTQPARVWSRTPGAAADLLRTCCCGQPLDCCHAGHCPRCGVTLRG